MILISSSPSARQWRFWLVFLCLVFVLLWLTRGILLPFVLGFTIAYLLNPLVIRLKSLGLHRTLAAALVLFVFILVLGLTLALILPPIQEQLMGLVKTLPEYIEHFRNHVIPRIESYLYRLPQEDAQQIRKAANDLTGTAVGWAGDVVTGLVSKGLALFDILALIFITPVVSFYILRDWEVLVRQMNLWLPRSSASIIRSQIQQMNQTLAGFIRGQAIVCLIMGSLYAISLSVIGLNFSLIVAIIAGLFTFIPYAGLLVGLLISLSVALFQFDSYVQIALVAGVFILGHALEANVLTPGLVGGRVGLHPVWIIFALLVGAHLFGFLGILLAVPMAAIIGVLIRFGLHQYMDSSYYKGEDNQKASSKA